MEVLSLNKITLDSISINTIKIKKIGGIENKVNATLPIAHYSAAGKTNTDTDRAILKDLSGNGHDISLYNFAWNTLSGYNGNGGLVFDGVDDYGYVTGLPILTDFTVIVNRKFTKFSNYCVLSKYLYSTQQGEFILEITDLNSSSNRAVSFGANKYISMPNDNGITFMTTNKYNGTNITKGNTLETNYMYIGKSIDYSRCFGGTISEIYLFDKVLPDKEILYYCRKINPNYNLPTTL